MGRITRRANLDQLDVFQEFISAAAAPVLSPERIGQMQLAVEEALVNIFNYAYGENGAGEVTAICDMDADGRFRVRFRDQGVAFDMLAAADPDTTLSVDDRAVGGLGIFFIKEMVDEVFYRRAGEVNELTFIFLPRPEDTP